MMNHLMLKSSCLLAALVLSVAGGCANDQTSAESSGVIPEVPASFEQGGVRWELQPTINSADEILLTNYFNQNQNMVGSPSAEGTPILFAASKNDRRFYWLHTGENQSTWFCVHFERGRFHTREGHGNPF